MSIILKSAYAYTCRERKQYQFMSFQCTLYYIVEATLSSDTICMPIVCVFIHAILLQRTKSMKNQNTCIVGYAASTGLYKKVQITL